MRKTEIPLQGNLNLRWILLILCIISFVSNSCERDNISGSGRIITEKREVDRFTAISVSGPFHVELLQGLREPVRIEAEDNIVPAIEAYVSGTMLRIRLRRGVNLRHFREIKVYVQSPVYEQVSFSGSGSLTTPDILHCTDLLCEINGNAATQLNLQADRLDVQVNGSGNARLEGQTRLYKSEINGSGDVIAHGLQTKEARIRIHGSGNHSISVEELMDIRILGSGDIRYKGSPTIRSSIMGSGRLIRI
ncbi:DUF2807 domain-containing protein [Chitinophaga pendula]|uniref:head GIN domain-containing protein n=1 Tax=Chitinophaga TaxID=79328 RepID=UPI000BAEEDBF|nr:MULTISPECIES: head GIN domain-containing protein [Chitinophaga]ASZ10771.1 hypothetical protein CK934_07165 [Chitinophaga sp. MD30]UCJ06251.1 DUF2807 domain-containing protein [Chitinophaga pendula]